LASLLGVRRFLDRPETRRLDCLVRLWPGFAPPRTSSGSSATSSARADFLDDLATLVSLHLPAFDLPLPLRESWLARSQ
jgi:hypothetical protein